MMKRIITNVLMIFLCCFVCSTVVSASVKRNKSDKFKPTWVTGALPNPSNSTYVFERITATSYSLDKARDNCYAQLINNSTTQVGAVVYADFSYRQDVHQKFTNGDLNETVENTSKLETHSKGEKHKLYVLCVDEYWEFKNGQYYVSRLYERSESERKPLFDEVEYSNRYGAAGLLSIIPGAGQMYKGDMAKGISFLVVDVACASGIVLCECTRAAYAAKITQQPQYAQQYSTKANNWSTGRNICIGVTAGIWLWNIIDAFAAKGARRVKVKPNKGYVTMTPSYQVNPISSTIDQGFGIAYHF